MTLEGARCDLHTGDAHPPRCTACEAAEAAAALESVRAIDVEFDTRPWAVPENVEPWIDDGKTV